MSKPTRYHPVLAVIHWVSALLVISMLLFGIFLLKQMPNTTAKIPFLAIHMVIGITILLLTITRIVVRFATKLPAPARSGNFFLDMLGNITHILLYIGMLGMGLSGLAIASEAGLMGIVFGRSGSALPQNLYIFPARIGHMYIALGLLALIGLHLAGVVYHQFLRKDKLISRMSPRKLTNEEK